MRLERSLGFGVIGCPEYDLANINDWLRALQKPGNGGAGLGVIDTDWCSFTKLCIPIETNVKIAPVRCLALSTWNFGNLWLGAGRQGSHARRVNTDGIACLEHCQSDSDKVLVTRRTRTLHSNTRYQTCFKLDERMYVACSEHALVALCNQTVSGTTGIATCTSPRSCTETTRCNSPPHAVVVSSSASLCAAS
jgi:hypothetical protein